MNIIIDDNEKDDECPVIVSSLDDTIVCNEVQIPLVAVAIKIDDWALMKITTRWFTIDTSRSSFVDGKELRT